MYFSLSELGFRPLPLEAIVVKNLKQLIIKHHLVLTFRKNESQRVVGI